MKWLPLTSTAHCLGLILVCFFRHRGCYQLPASWSPHLLPINPITWGLNPVSFPDCSRNTLHSCWEKSRNLLCVFSFFFCLNTGASRTIKAHWTVSRCSSASPRLFLSSLHVNYCTPQFLLKRVSPCGKRRSSFSLWERFISEFLSDVLVSSVESPKPREDDCEWNDPTWNSSHAEFCRFSTRRGLTAF